MFFCYSKLQRTFHDVCRLAREHCGGIDSQQLRSRDMEIHHDHTEERQLTGNEVSPLLS